MNSKKSRRLGLAKLLLGGAMSVLASNVAHAQFTKDIKIESEAPYIIETFEAPSIRPEFKERIFSYNLYDNFTFSRTDEPETKFAPITFSDGSIKVFYDIDGDGEFGKAEKDFQKERKKVYMSQPFAEEFLHALRTGLFPRLSELKNKNSSLEIQLQRLKEEYEIRPTYNQEKPKESERESKKKLWSLIVGGNANYKFDSFGGSIGLRVNPFKNKEIGLGALLDIGFGLDKKVDSFTSSLGREKTFYGEINDTNALSAGLSIETQFGPFIFGGGIDYSNWITKTTEQVLKGSEVLKSNVNSEPNRQVFGKGYLGIEIKPTKNWKLGLISGYHGKDSLYFGLRNNFRLNK